MSKKIFIYVFLFIFGLAWFIPPDMNIWKSFLSEYMIFISGFVLLLSVGIQKINMPKIIIPILIISFIPLIHFWIGFSFSYTSSILNFIYLFVFFLFIVLGYNLNKIKENNIIEKISCCLLIVSVVSSVFAIIQWLNLYNFLPVMELLHNRPYANLGQPNQLATLLIIGVISCLYFYETIRLPSILLIIISLLLIFAIALTQSRTSWVVVCVIGFYILFKRKKINLRLGTPVLLSWCCYFSLCTIMLPIIGKGIYILFDIQPVGVTSAIERVATQYERLALWTQNFYAIYEKPWFGYGWYQSGVSQLLIMDKFHFSPWYLSAHNIFIDILLWSGIVIGGPIILFYLYFLFKLSSFVKSLESLIAMLMVIPILIHGMLEFPLFYANFLFLLALLFGFLLASNESVKYIEIKRILVVAITIFYFLFLTLIWKEYLLAMSNISKARIIAINKIADRKNGISSQDRYISADYYFILKDFKLHEEWLVLDERKKVSSSELKGYEQFVLVNPSEYNLFKYAQILVYNGEKDRALKQLWLIQELYDKKYDYSYLLKTLN